MIIFYQGNSISIRAINFFISDRRNKHFVFATNNNYKIGLNTPSNRFRNVSNIVEKEWMQFEKDSFKLKAKIHIIQNGLEEWKYLL